MQNVNLLDRRLLPAQPLVPTGWALALVVVAGLAVVSHGLMEQQLTRRALVAVAAGSPASEAAKGAEAAAAAASGAAPLTRLREQVAERETLLAALRTQAAGPASPAATLAQVVGALPATMWLTDVEMHGVRELRISGQTLDPLALADFASRLATSEGLRGLPLQTLTLQMVEASESSPGVTPVRAHSFVLASQDSAAPEAR